VPLVNVSTIPLKTEPFFLDHLRIIDSQYVYVTIPVPWISSDGVANWRYCDLLSQNNLKNYFTRWRDLSHVCQLEIRILFKDQSTTFKREGYQKKMIQTRIIRYAGVVNLIKSMVTDQEKYSWTVPAS
jgi:hypothetical protein